MSLESWRDSTKSRSCQFIADIYDRETGWKHRGNDCQQRRKETEFQVLGAPTPVFLPGESQGQGSLVGGSPCGR